MIYNTLHRKIKKAKQDSKTRGIDFNLHVEKLILLYSGSIISIQLFFYKIITRMYMCGTKPWEYKMNNLQYNYFSKKE